MSFYPLDRELLHHPIWTDSGTFSFGQAWVDILLTANYADRDRFYRGMFQRVKRGQLYISKLYLANRWGWSEGRVDRFLKNLVEMEWIAVSSTKAGTVITVTHYGETNTAEDYAPERMTEEEWDDLISGRGMYNQPENAGEDAEEQTREQTEDKRHSKRRANNGTDSGMKSLENAGRKRIGRGTNEGTKRGIDNTVNDQQMREQTADRRRTDGDTIIKDNKENKDYKGERTARAVGVPLSVGEVVSFVNENRLDVDPDAFWNYYEAIGWVTSKGQAVRNWKALCRTWDGKPQYKAKDKTEDEVNRRAMEIWARDGETRSIYEIEHEVRSTLNKTISQFYYEALQSEAEDRGQQKDTVDVALKECGVEIGKRNSGDAYKMVHDALDRIWAERDAASN